MHIEAVQIARAPREKVFEAFTDYDAVPKWQSFFTRITVAKREGNTVTLDTEVNMRGRKVMRTEKHVLTPPEQILVEGEMEGITNNTVWKFESVPEGTRVTAIFEARLPWRLRIIGPLVKRQFQAFARGWLLELAKHVEKQ